MFNADMNEQQGVQAGGMPETIVATQKNGDGDLTAFKTSSGRVLTYEQALTEANSGTLAGVNVFKGT